MAEGENILMVAALDFGTTYSGYAFSMKSEYKYDPLKIHSNQAWNAGTRALLSLKTPTCLLLNKHRELVAFGYDAENKYSDLVMENEHKDHYYFHRFKMNLHDNENIKADMPLEDIRGNSMPAIGVFSLSIHALVSHLMGILETQGTGLEMDEINWVLTVPAIWSDTAKSFMRKSAEEAGIPQHRLLIALEPEAASIYCQYLPVEKLRGATSGFAAAQPGTTYMVVDLGGGTADITVHEKGQTGQLSEIYQATGNDCGGTSVDRRFYQIFEDIFGDVMTKLQRDDPSAYLDLLREFETVKRTINKEKTGKVNITIPYAAINTMCTTSLGKDLISIVHNSCYGEKIAIKGDKMRFEADFMREIFQPTIYDIIELMETIFDETENDVDISQILLVGGFSECVLIQEAVKEAFPEKRVIVPEDAGLAVLKGAVLFGHRPDYVESRVMRYTYGVEISVPFDHEIHDEEYRYQANGRDWCDKVFRTIVEKGEKVPVNTVVERTHQTVYEMQKSISLKIFITKEDDPDFTDDDGCTYLGAATMTFSEPCPGDRSVNVKFIFGNTELGLDAEDEISGEAISATFDLI